MTPDIFAYLDYRKFLKDWFEARAGRPSIRGFAKKVGASPAQLSSVIAGTRDLSGPLAEKVAGTLGADSDEHLYFLLLVQLEQAETRAQRREALEQIMGMRRFRLALTDEDRMYLVFSRWYYPAIIELARCPGFRPDPDWIADVLIPRVSRDEVVEALDVLLRGKFLVPDANGRLLPSREAFATSHQVGRVTSVALANLHRWMLARAPDALDEFPKEERHFGTMSLAVPEESLPALKQFVTRFEEDAFGRFWDHPNPTRVFQLSVQLFPLTKPVTRS